MSARLHLQHLTAIFVENRHYVDYRYHQQCRVEFAQENDQMMHGVVRFPGDGSSFSVMSLSAPIRLNLLRHSNRTRLLLVCFPADFVDEDECICF